MCSFRLRNLMSQFLAMNLSLFLPPPHPRIHVRIQRETPPWLCFWGKPWLQQSFPSVPDSWAMSLLAVLQHSPPLLNRQQALLIEPWPVLLTFVKYKPLSGRGDSSRPGRVGKAPSCFSVASWVHPRVTRPPPPTPPLPLAPPTKVQPRAVPLAGKSLTEGLTVSIQRPGVVKGIKITEISKTARVPDSLLWVRLRATRSAHLP